MRRWRRRAVILGQVLGGGASAGGLGGVLEKLNQGGYSQHAQSWVGSGQNLPLPRDAIRDVFGQGGLAKIAQQAGLSEDETSAGLAQLLPEVVNHVTPQGRTATRSGRRRRAPYDCARRARG